MFNTSLFKIYKKCCTPIGFRTRRTTCMAHIRQMRCINMGVSCNLHTIESHYLQFIEPVSCPRQISFAEGSLPKSRAPSELFRNRTVRQNATCYMYPRCDTFCHFVTIHSCHNSCNKVNGAGYIDRTGCTWIYFPKCT